MINMVIVKYGDLEVAIHQFGDISWRGFFCTKSLVGFIPDFVGVKVLVYPEFELCAMSPFMKVCLFLTLIKLSDVILVYGKCYIASANSLSSLREYWKGSFAAKFSLMSHFFGCERQIFYHLDWFIRSLETYFCA